MNEKHRNQFTKYLVREVARRVIPMALEATGSDDCIAHAKALRGLPDDVSMAEVEQACVDACDAADDICASAAAYYAGAVADAAYNAAYADFDDIAYDVGAVYSAYNADEIVRKEYDDILAEATALADAS